MTSLHVICGLGLPNQKLWPRLKIGDYLKNFFEDLFLENTCGRVLGPWPWPRAFLSLASRGSVLGKAVLGLGLEPCVLDFTSAFSRFEVIATSLPDCKKDAICAQLKKIFKRNIKVSDARHCRSLKNLLSVPKNLTVERMSLIFKLKIVEKKT